MCGADTGEAAGHNLAALGHKPLQQTDIPVWNGVNLLSAELADLLAAKELATTAGSTGTTWTASGTTAGSDPGPPGPPDGRSLCGAGALVSGAFTVSSDISFPLYSVGFPPP